MLVELQYGLVSNQVMYNLMKEDKPVSSLMLMQWLPFEVFHHFSDAGTSVIIIGN